MKPSLLIAIALTAGAAPMTRAAELQPATLAAWNAYLQQADSHAQERASGRLPFLWIDGSPDRLARVRRGEVIVTPVVGRGTESVPHGLVHDWRGAIFIPGATINDLWTVVHDYNDYQRMYRPVVTSSKELACAGDTQEFQMVWQRKVLFVSAALEGHYQARDIVVDPQRRYSVADAVEVREIESYGHKDQRLLPPDTGNGFIWRIRSIARFEQRDGGVYLELEAIALTRDVPASVAWLVNPVVNHLSVNSLTTTLRQTRDAVLSSRRAPESLASSGSPACASVAPKVSGD
jgi:hypothetical protein